MKKKKTIGSQKPSMWFNKRQLPLHLMVWPGMIVVFIYCYVPMYGLLMSFENYIPIKGITGSEWVGLDNFKFLFSMPDFWQVTWNTLVIAILKIIANLLVPIVVALMLNEVRKTSFKRGVQTAIYLPYFLSWVLLAGIMKDFLSPEYGFINQIIQLFGGDSIFFLGSNKWFRGTIIVTGIWKDFGFNTIVYLAALTGIDPTLYEAATMDGANRWQQTIHVTLPGIKPIIILLMTLSLGNLFNAGFDQIFNMYNPAVYETGDILDTMIYRMGLIDAKYSLSTALGLVKSVISCALLSLSYWLAYKVADYRIF